MKKILLMAWAIMAGETWAENWHEVGKNTDGTLQYFVDLDTVKKSNERIMLAPSGDFITAVVQATYLKGSKERKKGLYYSKSQYYISCENNTYFLNSGVSFDTKHNPMDTWQNRNTILYKDFDYAFPDSMIDGAIKVACNYYQNGFIKEAESFVPPPLIPNFDEFTKQSQSSTEHPKREFISGAELEKILPEHLKKTVRADRVTKLCMEVYDEFDDFEKCVKKYSDE